MTTREQWIAGARPKTLAAALAPVMVGTAFAGYNIKAFHAFLSLVVALALQVGVNYANDYSDGIRGTDVDRVGPLRLVGSGLATPESVKRAALVSFGIASAAGLLLAARTSWSLVVVGALAIAAAWTYTGGPRPYGYSGMGEISVFLFFGLVATLGTYFVQVESLSVEVFLASLAMGSFACAILVLNNLRDRERDEIAGKRTLAVIIGDSGTRDLYRWLLFSTLTVAAILIFYSFYFLIALCALPLAARLVRAVKSGTSDLALIPLLAATGRLQIIYSFLISLAALLMSR
ncbi:MAG: 1,4-dihydroxy-2-naphthoate polyprenyltransferase [Actinobacteria bacterium]|nr:1,4-dihydroxy-2-naphthoate polyprenyltransferase [Actinomycetota bacterium]